MHNHFQIAVLGLLSLKGLVSVVALPGVVGLVASKDFGGVAPPSIPSNLYTIMVCVGARGYV